jgi:hypothetical protein
MKTLFHASIQLITAGLTFISLGRWLAVPSILALAPIGYLLLAGGSLLLLVVALACLSMRWETPCSQETPD